MQIEAIIETTVRWVKSKKDRKAALDLSKPSNAEVKEAIEKCLNSGEQFMVERYPYLFIIKPEFPLIESAMEKPENQSLLKVSVNIYDAKFSCGVRP